MADLTVDNNHVTYSWTSVIFGRQCYAVVYSSEIMDANLTSTRSQPICTTSEKYEDTKGVSRNRKSKKDR